MFLFDKSGVYKMRNFFFGTIMLVTAEAVVKIYMVVKPKFCISTGIQTR